MADQLRTINLLRKSFFPHGLTERIVRCVFRFATIAGILFTSSYVELGGNVIGFLIAWTGLLALETSQSRALSTAALSSFWPGSRTQRILAGLSAVEIPALLLLVVLPFFARPSPLQLAVAATLLLAQNAILLVMEARKTDGKNTFEQFVRDGGSTFILPVVLAAIAIPVRDIAPMDTIVSSATMVAIIGSEISFMRRLTGFTPGLFVPGYLRKELRRFGDRQAYFVFNGTLIAGLISGFNPFIAICIAFSLYVGSYLLHYLLFLVGTPLGRIGMMLLFIVVTSVLYGAALIIDEHTQFTLPFFLGLAAIVALGAFAASKKLDDERIIRNR